MHSCKKEEVDVMYNRLFQTREDEESPLSLLSGPES